MLNWLDWAGRSGSRQKGLQGEASKAVAVLWVWRAVTPLWSRTPPGFVHWDNQASPWRHRKSKIWGQSCAGNVNSSEPGSSHGLTQVSLTAVLADVAYLDPLCQLCGDQDPGHCEDHKSDQSLLRLTSCVFLNEDRFGSRRSLESSRAGKGCQNLRILVAVGLRRCFCSQHLDRPNTEVQATPVSCSLPILCRRSHGFVGGSFPLAKGCMDGLREYFALLLLRWHGAVLCCDIIFDRNRWIWWVSLTLSFSPTYEFSPSPLNEV